jgi:hypothetical protein
MVPPATALTHNNAICAAARHTAASSAQFAARAGLTVAPQLPWAAASSVCKGLPFAVSQASDQKEAEDMMLLLLQCWGELQSGDAQAVAAMPQLRGQLALENIQARARRRGAARPRTTVRGEIPVMGVASRQLLQLRRFAVPRVETA